MDIPDFTKQSKINFIWLKCYEICNRLWRTPKVNKGPLDGSGQRLIFPKYRSGRIRISEQESRVLCCDILENSKAGFKQKYHYSIETPTEEKYGINPDNKRSAQSDLSLYQWEEGKKGKSFLKKVVNIEFKANQPVLKNIFKDIEKLVKEKIVGNWFHTFKNSDKRTHEKIFGKLIKSFLGDKEFSCEKNPFPKDKFDILFCICVLEQKEARYRRLEYSTKDSKNYKKTIEDFFKIKDFHDKNKWKLLKPEVS
jgi:hypothetical protein